MLGESVGESGVSVGSAVDASVSVFGSEFVVASVDTIGAVSCLPSKYAPSIRNIISAPNSCNWLVACAHALFI